MIEMYEEFKEEESGKSNQASDANYKQMRRIDAVYRFVEYILQSRQFGTAAHPLTWDDFEADEQNDIINYIVSKFYFVKGTSKIFEYLGYSGDTDTSLLGLQIVGNCMYDGKTVEIRFAEDTSLRYPDEAKFSRYITDFFKCLLFISSNAIESWEYYEDTVEGTKLPITEEITMENIGGIRVYKLIVPDYVN